MLNLKTIELAVEATVDHANRSEEAGQLARRVTLAQAQRLWGVDERTCRRVFDALIAGAILRRTIEGRYVRVST